MLEPRISGDFYFSFPMCICLFCNNIMLLPWSSLESTAILRSFSTAPLPHPLNVTLVFSFSQIFLISKLVPECIDSNSVSKFIEHSIYSTIQVTNEITEKDISELKFCAVIPFETWVSFDFEPLLTLKNIFRKNMNILISFIQLWYLVFSSYHSDIRELLRVPKEGNTFLSLQI